MDSGLTRREVLRAGAAAGALVGLERVWQAQVLERALAALASTCHNLSDIEHVVIFINENRSFDHYFGGYKGVRGFADHAALRLGDGSGLSVFAQPFAGPAGVPYGGHLLPFHFDTTSGGECINDITHEWVAQHKGWNGGAMDKFLQVRLDDNGLRDGPNTMGYYQRSDLPFYYALADAFTICDGYYCSLIGPTDPNRLYSMSATIDPDGKAGGPLLETLVTNRPSELGKFSWTTYPEQLETGGISWKVYGTPDGNAGDNILPYFKQYQSNASLAAKALGPSFPAEFQADCAAGTLPQVSWVNGSLVDSEHPPAPVTYGEVVVAQILDAITSNPSLWAKTAVFITYDENGGFFDHVPPPVAPPGTPGEYLTVNPLPATAGGIRGPIGLGFRVPMLVVSPFARGGLVCSDTFDHTSLLRFLETRFGPEVPNLTAWRRSVTGDLTSAFNFAAPGRVGASAADALSSRSARDRQRLPNTGPGRRQPDLPDCGRLPIAAAAPDDAWSGVRIGQTTERSVRAGERTPLRDRSGNQQQPPWAAVGPHVQEPAPVRLQAAPAAQREVGASRRLCQWPPRQDDPRPPRRHDPQRGPLPPARKFHPEGRRDYEPQAPHREQAQVQSLQKRALAPAARLRARTTSRGSPS